MISEIITDHIARHINNSYIVPAMTQHLRITMDNAKFNRLLEMIVTDEDDFVHMYADIESHVNTDAVLNILKKDSSKDIIDNISIKNVDIVGGTFDVEYSYHPVFWYSNEECTLDKSYYKSDKRPYSKVDVDDVYTTIERINYLDNNVF